MRIAQIEAGQPCGYFLDLCRDDEDDENNDEGDDAKLDSPREIGLHPKTVSVEPLAPLQCGRTCPCVALACARNAKLPVVNVRATKLA